MPEDVERSPERPRQELRRLAAYLAEAFPGTPGPTPVDQVLWLLEHLHRIETMQPPLLRTLHTRQQAQRRVKACVA